MAKRTNKVSGIVIHHTGSGIVRRWRERGGGEQDKIGFGNFAAEYYRNAKFKPHYLVDQLGRVHTIAPEDEVVWHTGRGNTKDGTDFGGAPPRYWLDRWESRGFTHPTQLGVDGNIWLGGSCNANTVGIEVLPDITHPTGCWSIHVLFALRATAYDIMGKIGVPPLPKNVVGHYDANPRARHLEDGRPWDPWEHQWSPTVCEALFL